MSPRVPRVARALLAQITPESDRAYVLEDLEETFQRMAEEEGVGPARRWYRAQVVLSLPLVATRLREGLGAFSLGELRGAFRVIRRRPLYALGISGTLGVGLASAILLGGVAWRVWLQPLPFSDSEKLVRIYELGRPDAAGERDRGWISPPLLRDLRAQEFSHLVDFAGVIGSNPEWTVQGEVRPLTGSSVSPGFFELLGVTALHGRLNWASSTGAEVPETVLSESFWRQNFGGDPGVVGSTIDIGGEPHLILGVVRQEGGYPRPVDVFTPLVFEERQLGEGMRGARYMEVIARVRTESSLEVAGTEFAAFIESLGDAHPIHDGWSGEVASLRDDLTGPFRDVLRLLIAAGAAFLLLALVNVIGLASTRALERRQEMSVRRALGASRGRLFRGEWMEGAVLGAIGGTAAIAFGLLIFPRTISWLPQDLARSSEVGVSGLGAVGWLALSVLAGGWVAVIGHRLAPKDADLRSGGRTTGSGRTGRMLVAGQLALTTLLVGVGTIVLERSIAIADHDFGFQAEGVYSGFVTLPRSTHEDWEARRDSWGGIVAALDEAGVPAAITTNPPMSGMNSNYGYARPGDETESFGQYSVVSRGYFDVMGIPMLSGRTFEPGESAPVTIISQALADLHFPGEDPVGQNLSILGQENLIIGVVASTAHFGPDSPEPPAMYVSYESVNWDFAHVVAQGDASLGSRIREAVERVAPGTREPDVAPYEDHLANWFRPLRIQLGIVGALALVGGLLAGLGLYANIAYQVRGQLRELGIRVALGASRIRILSGVVRSGMLASGLGLAVGLVLWWTGRERLGEILGTGTSVFSSFTLGMTGALILVLSLVSVLIPAFRASAADPLTSLRSD